MSGQAGLGRPEAEANIREAGAYSARAFDLDWRKKPKAFALTRESLSLLVHCAEGANGEAGPQGERSESRK